MAPGWSEREERQLDLMREQLERYRNGEIRLPKLIADLDALIDALEEADPAWRRSLRERWAVFEEVYAVSLDRGVTELDEEGRGLVRRAVDDLLQLLVSKREVGETD
jgi:hypothetical protein